MRFYSSLNYRAMATCIYTYACAPKLLGRKGTTFFSNKKIKNEKNVKILHFVMQMCQNGGLFEQNDYKRTHQYDVRPQDQHMRRE